MLREPQKSADIWQKVIILKHLSFCQLSAKLSVSIKRPNAAYSALESKKMDPEVSKIQVKDL